MSRKRQDIIDAASTVFVKDGFFGANIDEIALLASVSKRTLYRYFASKTDLFGAVVSFMCEIYHKTLKTEVLAGHGPYETLSAFAKDYLDVVLSAEALDLHRMVLSEAKRFPELGETLRMAASEPARWALAEYLTIQNELGTILVPDTTMAADQFFGLIIGSMRNKALYDPELPARRHTLDRWIESAVQIFMNGCAKPGSRTSKLKHVRPSSGTRPQVRISSIAVATKKKR